MQSSMKNVRGAQHGSKTFAKTPTLQTTPNLVRHSNSPLHLEKHSRLPSVIISYPSRFFSVVWAGFKRSKETCSKPEAQHSMATQASSAHEKYRDAAEACKELPGVCPPQTCLQGPLIECQSHESGHSGRWGSKADPGGCGQAAGAHPGTVQGQGRGRQGQGISSCLLDIHLVVPIT